MMDTFADPPTGDTLRDSFPGGGPLCEHIIKILKPIDSPSVAGFARFQFDSSAASDTTRIHRSQRASRGLLRELHELLLLLHLLSSPIRGHQHPRGSSFDGKWSFNSSCSQQTRFSSLALLCTRPKSGVCNKHWKSARLLDPKLQVDLRLL